MIISWAIMYSNCNTFLLKNGLLTFEEKIAWKTFMVCLKSIDVSMSYSKNLMFLWNFKGIMQVSNVACTPNCLALYYMYYMTVLRLMSNFDKYNVTAMILFNDKRSLGQASETYTWRYECFLIMPKWIHKSYM